MTSWPLLSPAVPPAAAAASIHIPQNQRSQRSQQSRQTQENARPSKSVRVVSPQPAPTYRDRLSAPTKDASKDYHLFIESVGKASRTPVFGQPASPTPDRPADEPPKDTEPAQPKSPKSPKPSKTSLPVGTTRLFERGRMRVVPLPSAHPCDPLNLPDARKWAAVTAMSVAAGFALGSLLALDGTGSNGSVLLPVMALEYAGVAPTNIGTIVFRTFLDGDKGVPAASLNTTAALAALAPLAELAPLAANTDASIGWLAAVPLFTAAAAGYLQIPLADALGRRPVLLLSLLLGWVGAVWAGVSSLTPAQSLASLGTPTSALAQHVAARALIGLAAGSANALVPLVAAQDLFFLHQRHVALAVSVSLQALVVAGLAAGAPHLVAVYNWRWLYYIAGAGGFAAWLAVVLLVPETRWARRSSADHIGGGCGADAGPVFVDDLPAHQKMARLDYYGYGARTRWTDLGVFVVDPLGRVEPRRALQSLLDLLRTLLLPQVVWVAAVQAALLVASRAMAELTVDTLLLGGTPFSRIGLLGITWGAGAVLTLLAAGLVVGDHFSLGVTRHLRAQQKQKYRRMSLAASATAASRDELHTRLCALLRDCQKTTVRREAEHSLPGLVLPLAVGIAGCFFFGVILDRSMPASLMAVALVTATSFLATGMFLFNVGGSVFLIESFPAWAGPCLAHANGLRFLAAYALSSAHSPDSFRSYGALLVATKGALEGWAVFAEALLVLSLGLPALVFGGRAVRHWAAGTVQAGHGDDLDSDSEEHLMPRAKLAESPGETFGRTDSPATTDNASDLSFSAGSFESDRTPPAASVASARYTGPHPGTRANIVFPRESFASHVALPGRAM